jgi:hypothetical protein
MRVLTSSVLIMEAIVLLLAIPVAVMVGDQPGWIGGLFAALALACALLPAMFRRHFFVPAGWALQGLVLASGVLIGWIMVTLGVVFTALWWTALRLGRKAEASGTPG